MAKLSRYAMALVLWGFWTVALSFSGLEQNLSMPPPPSSFEADLLRIDGMRGWNDRFLSEMTPKYSIKRKPATAFNYGSNRMDMLKPL